jgi:hypothetical protein
LVITRDQHMRESAAAMDMLDGPWARSEPSPLGRDATMSR